jgi:tetratricopeptide (TPR) repeat protein
MRAQSLIRLLCGAAFGAALPLKVASADCPASGAQPSAEYAKLVGRYQAGDEPGALSALGAWDEARLDCELKALQAAARKAAKCERCPEQLVFERFSLRAALLLHGDREAEEKLRPPVSEQAPPSCGIGLHARLVERLADLLQLVDRDPGDFLRRYYLGLARRAHWSQCLSTAELLARAGLKRSPRDAALLLTLGIAEENDAFHERAPTSRSQGLSGKQRDLWEDAQRTFEEALAADPALDEARLRLGRVLWRLGKNQAARASFDAVLAKDLSDASLAYLAHLFLGRLDQDEGRRADAEKHYAAALAMRSGSEPAAVALSHMRLLQGDPDAARDVLNKFLVYGHRRREIDPFVGYLMAHTGAGERTLEELRAETR